MREDDEMLVDDIEYQENDRIRYNIPTLKNKNTILPGYCVQIFNWNLSFCQKEKGSGRNP